MIAFPAGTKVWIAGGVTDMRRGMNTLALAVQQGLGRDPHGGEIFCFRGRKGDLVKLLWHDGVGMSLYTKRLEAGKFIWPVSQDGTAVSISAAQLAYLLEGIDWRNPRWTQRPAKACVFHGYVAIESMNMWPRIPRACGHRFHGMWPPL
jgi:transposase